MFDAFSRWLKKFFLDYNSMSRIIRWILNRNLHHNYSVVVFDEFPPEILSKHSEYQELDGKGVDDLTGITFMSGDRTADNTLGYMLFSLRAIRRSFDDCGYVESIGRLRDVVLHECRHVEQFEFLRERGGEELVNRVVEDQKKVPYFQNLFELDAYYYQFTGEKLNFEKLFARYLSK